MFNLFDFRQILNSFENRFPFRYVRRSSPLAGRESSGYLAKSENGSPPRSWPENLTISPASGEDSGRGSKKGGGGRGRSWPVSLTIWPASGEDSWPGAYSLTRESGNNIFTKPNRRSLTGSSTK